MLLIVTPTAEETEAWRHTFAKLHTFVYSATYHNFVTSAENFSPDAIFLIVHEVTDTLLNKLERVRMILPEISLITVSECDVAALSPSLTYSPHVQKFTLKFQAHYFAKKHAYGSVLPGSRMISGLLLVPFDEYVFLRGRPANFTAEEVFLLRCLAEHHPRRMTEEELGKYCFTYGKKTPRTTVAARISRINKEASRIIASPIITHKTGEGYGIDF